MKLLAFINDFDRVCNFMATLCVLVLIECVLLGFICNEVNNKREQGIRQTIVKANISEADIPYFITDIRRKKGVFPDGFDLLAMEFTNPALPRIPGVTSVTMGMFDSSTPKGMF